MAIFFVFNYWSMLYILETTNKFLKHPNFFRPSISLYLNVLLPLQKIGGA